MYEICRPTHKVGETWHFKLGKKCINFQHCFILKLVKYVATHMAKKCNKFPTLFHFKALVKYVIWRKNAIK